MQLRRDAKHYRDLANSQVDDRVRLILGNMADEFDQRAADLDGLPERSPQPR